MYQAFSQIFPRAILRIGYERMLCTPRAVRPAPGSPVQGEERKVKKGGVCYMVPRHQHLQSFIESSGLDNGVFGGILAHSHLPASSYIATLTQMVRGLASGFFLVCLGYSNIQSIEVGASKEDLLPFLLVHTHIPCMEDLASEV
jgi:hypothetical protein